MRFVKVPLANHWSSVTNHSAMLELMFPSRLLSCAWKSVQFSWLLRNIQNTEAWTVEAPAPGITRYRWSGHQEGPGSGLRTSSGCGHQPGILRETYKERLFTSQHNNSPTSQSLLIFTVTYPRGWKTTHGGLGFPGAPEDRVLRGSLHPWGPNQAPSS